MKTKEEVLAAVKAGRESQCLDQRDYSRLVDFYPAPDWKTFGFQPLESSYLPKEWTEESIKEQLRKDVAFGFEKALGRRGLSSSFMYEVVKVWMWVLDDDLQNFKDYKYYGLPLFKAVANKYGFEDPIPKHTGSEKKFDG